MKAIFIHDHPFHEFNGEFYSPATFPSNIWKRYLSVFEEIVVVGRGRSVFDNKGLSLSSCENVVFKPYFGVSGGVDYLLKKRKIKKHLKPLIKQADAIILRLPSFFGECAVEICNQLGRPYLAEMVGCSWDSSWNYGSVTGKLRAPFSLMKTKQAIKNACGVIYVTEHFLQQRYPTNAQITSYASNVYIEEFSEEVLSNHQLYLKSDKTSYKLALLANLQVKYKGFEVIFKALELAIKKLDKPVVLYLYGGGKSDYIKSLVRKYRIEENVKIMGLLNSGQEVYEALDGVDLYVHPSLTEGLPRAVIEAMSRGCPVLASSAGGIPELLDSNYLHKPGDYNKLAEQLFVCLSNENKLLEMSKDNFFKAKNYTSSILNERRNKFWVRAENYLLNCKNEA